MATLCITCLVISIVITLVFAINWGISINNKRGFLFGKKSKSNYSLVTPFNLLILGVFISATVLFIPVFHATLDPTGEVAMYFKIPLLSAHNALQLFTINANFDSIRDTINMFNGISSVLADFYTVYTAFYFILCPLLTAVVILSLAKGLYERWKYFRTCLVKKIYVFSELNENSIALAEDILVKHECIDEDVQQPLQMSASQPETQDTNNKQPKIKRIVLFANVTPKFQEENPELVARAKDMGALCLQNDITHIHLKSPKRKIYRKAYLIGLDEDDNTAKALKLIDIYKRKYNSPLTQIFVFSTTDENGILIDSVVSKPEAAEKNNDEEPQQNNCKQRKSKESKDKACNCKKCQEKEEQPLLIKVRRVIEKRNLIWTTLAKTEKELGFSNEDKLPIIFQNTIEANGKKDINLLIIGLGQYGMELLKTACWYCQMPDYRLHIYVFDKQGNCEQRVKSVAPELVELSHKDGAPIDEGEAFYQLHLDNRKIDVNEWNFIDKINSLPEITLAFVTLGWDKINIDTAIKLRRIFGKKAAENGMKVPPILTVVYDSEKTTNLNYGSLLKSNASDNDYGIRFIGDITSRYSLLNVEQLNLERKGMACHMHWAKVNQKRDENEPEPDFATLQQDWQENEKMYNTYEYCRMSSMAQAMYLEARSLLCNSSDTELLKQMEHNRWNAYMRADGYMVSPNETDEALRVENGDRKKKDTIAKIHPDLVNYNRLTKNDKEKDNMPDLPKLLAGYAEKSAKYNKVDSKK